MITNPSPGTSLNPDSDSISNSISSEPQTLNPNHNPNPNTNPNSDTISIPSPTKGSSHPLVHIFYYSWYSNPTDNPDGGWNHWNHNIIPHWNADTRQKYLHDVKYPAELGDIGSVYYPKRGLYFSGNEELLEEHMRELKDYLVVVSWWGRDLSDGEGMTTDKLMHKIFQAADKFGTKVAFHLEPYQGRTILTIQEDLKYIYNTYSTYTSFYRFFDKITQKHLPVIYIYDSYLIDKSQWRELLLPDGKYTIRDTDYDAVMIGLYLDSKSKDFFAGSGFDGVYTYFASERFTEGSTPDYWSSITSWAHSQSLSISISVGPGYDDTRVRPWNALNTKRRNDGEYYNNQWRKAIDAKPDWISVTSYNEWMEGTQIEEAVPFQIPSTIMNNNKPYTYQDYNPLKENYYIQKTEEWTTAFLDSKQQ